MKFIDFDGSGGIDSRDIATSVSVENAARSEESERDAPLKRAESNAGCATMAAHMALPILILLMAL